MLYLTNYLTLKIKIFLAFRESKTKTPLKKEKNLVVLLPDLSHSFLSPLKSRFCLPPFTKTDPTKVTPKCQIPLSFFQSFLKLFPWLLCCHTHLGLFILRSFFPYLPLLTSYVIAPQGSVLSPLFFYSLILDDFIFFLGF